MTPEQILNSSNTERRGRFDKRCSDSLPKMLYSHLDCRWECVCVSQVRVCQVGLEPRSAVLTNVAP